MGACARRVGAVLTTVAVLTGSMTDAHATTVTWRPQTVPAVFGQPALQSSVALSATNVWAVGQTRISVGGATETRLVAMHWNGHTWKRVSTPDRETEPATDYAYGLAGASANDLWLVGYAARDIGGGGSTTLVEHWDGSHWSLVDSPNPTGASYFLAASSPRAGDLWAVGAKADPTQAAYPPLVAHRRPDGTWQEVPWTSPIAGCAPRDTTLTGVLARSSTDVYVGGDCKIRQHHRGFVAHWDGVQWTAPVVGTVDTEITGLGGGRNGGEVWAVGDTVSYRGTDSTTRGIAYHGSGSTWAFAPMPAERGRWQTVTGVSVGTGPRAAVYAVARAFAPDNSYDRGRIYRWNGTAWLGEPIDANYPEILNSAASAPDGSAWAFGWNFGAGTYVCAVLNRVVS